MQGVIRIGLTGGIGCGKSTVAAMLAGHGAAVVDADAIARQLTAPGGAAIDAIRREFGPAFIAPDGALDRDKMRALVFAEPQARQRLEAIIHPLIGQETERQMQAARDGGHRCIVFDMPLLLESDQWRQHVDQVLVVDCSPHTQIERTMRRSGLTRAAVESIIAAQVSREARLAAADIVLCNEGLTLDELAGEVQRIARGFGL